METESSRLRIDQNATMNPLVLVVDDDLPYQRMMEFLADRLQISVVVVSSCAQAVDSVRKFNFDLILMDYRMPEVDGCRCVQIIREMSYAGSEIPIITVTAHATDENRRRCAAAGMNDFLEKPFTIEQITNLLERWLKNRPRGGP